MIETKELLHEALKTHFGFDKFKGHQEQIIQSVLDHKDTFVIMPTGGGKSLCYQLPAIMMEGTAIVISPLIALMKNQVDSIRGYSQNDDVASFLNSSLNKSQMKKVKEDITAGKTKLLFIAPETLTKDENLAFFKEVNISFVAVDEAHCISEWGHDFRPEYRRIRLMIDEINKEIPIIALTATATPKVRTDIVKNLNMRSVREFVSSFNRENLYYEVRPKGKKEQTFKSIVQVIKGMADKSGIIYVQSRKSTEEIAEVLRVNGIKASAYHAGLDAKTRTKVQDDFLMEQIDVICATIAFGMGIDKPDVRFVIHYDIPKSIENYYQETGRAGRDGMEGRCITYYRYKDILKLEKFLRDKSVSEREMGAQLLQEIMAFSETAACRRRFLLHYFGEEYAEEKCGKKCDNCKHPKERIEVQEYLHQALRSIQILNENFKIKSISEFLIGNKTKEMQDFKFDELDLFGIGKDKDLTFWKSLLRQALLQNLIYKDIENYGILRLTEKGTNFITKPEPFHMSLNHDYTTIVDTDSESSKTGTLDKVLVGMLKDLRKQVAHDKKVPPYVIFQDPSLADMATQYPITMDEMANISGVSIGKAKRYAKPFIELISQYVDENNIERPTDFVVKQVANRSKIKVNIIQSIDRKIPLEDIASSNNLSMEELMEELDAIIISGTKVNLDYYIEDNMDENAMDDILDYFMESESDSVEEAFKELKEDDITMDEIQLVRIKFLSDTAN